MQCYECAFYKQCESICHLSGKQVKEDDECSCDIEQFQVETGEE
ncbi:MAG: hypothetical protein PHE73_03450 [Sulfurovaceae bacterium]|nr:hypothetical protein [Sulfurovaceae bacterium]